MRMASWHSGDKSVGRFFRISARPASVMLRPPASADRAVRSESSLVQGAVLVGCEAVDRPHILGGLGGDGNVQDVLRPAGIVLPVARVHALGVAPASLMANTASTSGQSGAWPYTTTLS